MPDWKRVVCKRFRILSGASPESAEELAGHLEDRHEGYLRAGMSADIAIQRTLDEFELTRGNWLTLRLLKEDIMKGFERRIGLPGVAAFATAMVIAWALDVAHIQPKTIFLANGLFLPLPIVWFCLLPFCGVLGAIISRRNGGTRLDRMIAGAFPAVILFSVLMLIFFAGWAISFLAADYSWNWAMAVPALALWMAGYAIMTAIALLAGAAVVEQAQKRSIQSM
jgi:hypothetical protein